MHTVLNLIVMMKVWSEKKKKRIENKDHSAVLNLFSFFRSLLGLYSVAKILELSDNNIRSL